MKVKAIKSGQYQKRFYREGDIFEVPDEHLEQYKDFFSVWVEPSEEQKEEVKI